MILLPIEYFTTPQTVCAVAAVVVGQSHAINQKLAARTTVEIVGFFFSRFGYKKVIEWGKVSILLGTALF